MNSEDFPQQSGIDQSTTLGAPENGPSDAFDATTADQDVAEPEVDHAPMINDVSGLEDLYMKTDGVLSNQAGGLFQPTSADQGFGIPVDGADIPIAVARDDDGSDFNPTRTEQIIVDDVRLPPPLDVGAALRFSFEPGIAQPPAWSYDDGIDDGVLIELQDDRGFAQGISGGDPSPQAVRSPGQQKRKPSLFDSVSDLADRRWFWAAAVVIAVLGLQGVLLVSGLMPNPLSASSRPDVVADGGGGEAVEPQAVTTTQDEGDKSTESTNSARFGNRGIDPNEAASEEVDDGTDTTVAAGSTAGKRKRKPTTTVGTTGSPGSTTTEPSTTSSLTTTSTGSSSTTQLTTTTTWLTTTTSVTTTTSRPSTTTTTATSTTLTTTTEPNNTTTTDPDAATTTTETATTTTDPDDTTTTMVETTTTTEAVATTTIVIEG